MASNRPAASTVEVTAVGDLTPKGRRTSSPKWLADGAIWSAPPENVASAFGANCHEGFRNFYLGSILGYSLFRVVVGFFFGALVGIPLGYAMGLSQLVPRLV